MPFDTLLHNPGTYVIVLIGLGFSWIVIAFIADINPSERRLTRKRWVRWLLVVAGPILVPTGLIFLMVMRLYDRIIETITEKMLPTFRAFLQEPPTLSDAAIFDAAGADAEQRMARAGD